MLEKETIHISKEFNTMDPHFSVDEIAEVQHKVSNSITPSNE